MQNNRSSSGCFSSLLCRIRSRALSEVEVDEGIACVRDEFDVGTSKTDPVLVILIVDKPVGPSVKVVPIVEVPMVDGGFLWLSFLVHSLIGE